jgi:hypothetical protein
VGPGGPSEDLDLGPIKCGTRWTAVRTRPYKTWDLMDLEKTQSHKTWDPVDLVRTRFHKTWNPR